jgi:hypothetical protein
VIIPKAEADQGVVLTRHLTQKLLSTAFCFCYPAQMHMFTAARRIALASGLAFIAVGCGGSQEIVTNPPQDGPDRTLFTKTAEGGTVETLDAAEGKFKVILSGVPPQVTHQEEGPNAPLGTVAADHYMRFGPLAPGAHNDVALIILNDAGDADDEVFLLDLEKPVWDADNQTFSFEAKIKPSSTGMLGDKYNGKNSQALPANFGGARVHVGDCPPWRPAAGREVEISGHIFNDFELHPSPHEWKVSSQWYGVCYPMGYSWGVDFGEAWHNAHIAGEAYYDKKYPEWCHERFPPESGKVNLSGRCILKFTAPISFVY